MNQTARGYLNEQIYTSISRLPVSKRCSDGAFYGFCCEKEKSQIQQVSQSQTRSWLS
jgi:hypothetical protein